MSKLHIRKDDTVIVISGSEKGKKGKVVAVSPDERKVIIEGINIKKKHTKPRREGEVGGIVDVEGAMYACKVQVYCPKCDCGVRTGIKLDGDKKIRVCKKCGKEI